MTVRRGAAMLAAAALMQSPTIGEARALTIRACGGAMHLMIVPGSPLTPQPRRECAKACHVVAERRGKNGDPRRSCC